MQGLNLLQVLISEIAKKGLYYLTLTGNFILINRSTSVSHIEKGNTVLLSSKSKISIYMLRIYEEHRSRNSLTKSLPTAMRLKPSRIIRTEEQFGSFITKPLPSLDPFFMVAYHKIKDSDHVYVTIFDGGKVEAGPLFEWELERCGILGIRRIEIAPDSSYYAILSDSGELNFFGLKDGKLLTQWNQAIKMTAPISNFCILGAGNAVLLHSGHKIVLKNLLNKGLLAKTTDLDGEIELPNFINKEGTEYLIYSQGDRIMYLND